mgnify:CR=1 FL=1
MVILTCLVQIVATLNVTVARSCPAARVSKALHCVVHYAVIHFVMVHCVVAAGHYAVVVVHCAGVVDHYAVAAPHCVAEVPRFVGVALRPSLAVHCVAAVHKLGKEIHYGAPVATIPLDHASASQKNPNLLAALCESDDLPRTNCSSNEASFRTLFVSVSIRDRASTT